jgi:hypothetical protein
MLARGVIEGWMNKKCELWQSVHGQMQARGYLRRPSDKRTGELLNLSRNWIRIMTKLLTGHSHLKRHLFKLGLADHP